MSHTPPIPAGAVFSPYLPTPPGWRRVGLAFPSGVTPPPNAIHEQHELALVEQLNAAANNDPDAQAFIEFLADKGGWGLWMDFARQYRHSTGLIRGWLGTGLLATTLGVNALRTMGAKGAYGRLRPYQVDGNIKPIGKLPKDESYPSGHSSSAHAAATVMSHLWPQRAYEFNWWARQVALSRVAAGVHFPSDVQMGALLGHKIGTHAASILY